MIVSKFKYQCLDNRIIRGAVNWLSPWSTHQLILSLNKAYTFFRCLFGRKPQPLPVRRLTNKDLLIKKFPDSRLLRLIFRQKEQIKRYYEISHFKSFNRRTLLNGTGFTFGIVGISIKNDGVDLKLPFTKRGLDFKEFFCKTKSPIFEVDKLREDIDKSDCIEFDNFISKGCCGAVHKGKIRDDKSDSAQDVAVKIMFNFEFGSDSASIIRSSIKECVPYNGTFGVSIVPRKTIPSHPNIVKILSVFVDHFKPLKESRELYPFALPEEFGGYGHSRTLFIMQKLYDMSLKDYLYDNYPSEQTSLAILVQCFEAIDFLNRNQVAHRDLKLDNILVSLDENEDFPWIVITDFGLCSTSLKIPYESEEVCKGGNRALMPPEIINAQPSRWNVLNYHKSDLWAMATIAYEIFGANNPFYRKYPGITALDSANYREDDIPDFTSELVLLPKLIRMILRRNPNTRPSNSFVSSYCHLLFQYGSDKLRNVFELDQPELRKEHFERWFKTLSYKSVYEIANEQILSTNSYRMRIMFLSKLDLDKWIDIVEKARNIFLYGFNFQIV